MNLLDYIFFRHALIGGLLAAVLCAIVGTYVVTRRMVIAGGGMAHASLGGVGMGAYLGISPLLGAAFFALLSGFSIQWLSRKGVREDSAIAMLWTLGMAVGILFAFLTPGFMTDLQSFLFGDILSIQAADLYMMGTLTGFAALYFTLRLRRIVTVAYDRDFAVTQGIPVTAIESVLTTLVALTIVACLRIVGIVLVISLLSVPQQTAALYAKTFRGIIFLSALLGYGGIVSGLLLSWWLDVPSGAAIILVSITVYMLCRLERRYRTTHENKTIKA